MAVTQFQVLEALGRIKGPDLEGTIVSLGLVSQVVITEGRVVFSITVPASRAGELEPLRQAAESVVAALPGVTGVSAVLTADAERGKQGRGGESVGGSPAEHPRVAAARARGQTGDAPRPIAAAPPKHGAAPVAKPLAPIPGVRHLIAVASGKGGVGKSTVAVNLALGLQALGLKAGILDADIFGPSQPRLLGLKGRPAPNASGKLEPLRAFGLKAMSMGFMVDEGTPIVWRGPMVVQALNQMLREVAWSSDGAGGSTAPLDVLVIDMPPGTGDVQLTMAQQAPLSGAVIVSTPQDLALIDARKGLAMFQKVNVPVLGLVENMSLFICPKCGERTDIFGHGGAKAEAEKLKLPFLGGIPLHLDIRTTSDAGRPLTATSPKDPHAILFRELAARVWDEVQAVDGKRVPAPTLTVSPDGSNLNASFKDGRAYDLSAEYLRVMSPSAEVQGHSAASRVTVGGKRNVKIRDLRPVGTYAVRIDFDDGHDTGLFTWDYLVRLADEKPTRWPQYEAELKAKGLRRG